MKRIILLLVLLYSFLYAIEIRGPFATSANIAGSLPINVVTTDFQTEVKLDILTVSPDASAAPSVLVLRSAPFLGNGTGADVDIKAGDGAGSGGGGDITIVSGIGLVSGSGGDITLTAKDGGTTGGLGGDIILEAGDGDPTGPPTGRKGNVVLSPGTTGDGGGVVIANSVVSADNFISTPQATQNVVAGTSITSNVRHKRIVGQGGAIDLTSNPQIADGTYDGQLIILEGLNDTNTVKLDDSNGLALDMDASFTMGLYDTIALRYNSVLDIWIEQYRSDN